jgi:hypothetical protein
MYQTSPQVIIRLHPQSLPMVSYPRPLPHVFLSMLPPYTLPWRPSTSTYSLRPVSTIIGRRCGCTLIMPPVGAQDRGINVRYNPCTTPLTPSVWLICTTRGEGAVLPLFGRGTPGFQAATIADCSILFMQTWRQSCCFWSPCRGRAFSEISKSRGRPIHPLPCQ